jgi:hypothetical protein
MLAGFRADAALAAENMRLAWQEAAAAQAAASAAREETRRVRDDAEKTLAGFRAEAAAELTAAPYNARYCPVNRRAVTDSVG